MRAVGEKDSAASVLAPLASPKRKFVARERHLWGRSQTLKLQSQRLGTRPR